MRIDTAPKDLSDLSYGLVLLQEICQGYDTPEYRNRADKFIVNSTNIYISSYLLPRWRHGSLSTPDFIHKIEEDLLRHGAIRMTR